MKLNHPENYWQEKGASLTAAAIVAQPRLWQEGLAIVTRQQQMVQAFWQRYTPHTRIIITGAGSSLLAAQACQGWLRAALPNQIDIIPATDLILSREPVDEKCVLVSVSSSGNTPETVNVVEYLLARHPELAHLAITNNAQSRLAMLAQEQACGLFIPVPEGTSNGSFAATAEFTVPLLYLMLLLAPHKWDEINTLLPVLARGADYFLTTYCNEIEHLANTLCDNVVAIGSLSLKSVACETSLKLLEMNNGKIMTAWHSMLEFRHGPKLIINRDVSVIGYLAAQPDIHRYDEDMMMELTRERSAAAQIIAVGHAARSQPAPAGDHYFHFACPELADYHEGYCALLYVLFAQVTGLFHAISLGVTPDTPSVDGKVAKVARVKTW